MRNPNPPAAPGTSRESDMAGRPLAPPVEPPPGGSRGAKWRTVALALVTAAGLLVCGVVMLVLTGIIAEPETVIEQIVRTLSGQ